MGKKKQPKDELTMKQAECFLTYMCDLLLAHPTFNFSFNILHAITPVLDSNKPNARLIVKKTIEQVFKVSNTRMTPSKVELIIDKG